jgi:two-component system, LuxR family, response regulator FixJ
MNEEPTVSLIDDDAAVRDALGVLLMGSGFHVEAYASGARFLEIVASDYEGCIVCDIRMPELDGIELLKQIRARHIEAPVVFITAFADVPLAVQAMKLGASDFLEKPFQPGALTNAIRVALEDHVDRGSVSDKQAFARARLDLLTERENEVLEALLKGMPNKVIAHELGVATRTVEAHRAKIMAKMKVGSLAELVRVALMATE